MSKFLRNDYLWALFWLSFLIVIFFLPVILGFQSLTEAIPTVYDRFSDPPPQLKTPWTSDGATHARGTIPMVLQGVRMMRQGMPPLWMAYSGGGEVLAGDTVSGLMYPLRLIFFSIWPSVRAFDWYFLLRFLIAGFGTFLFLKEIGLQRNAALFGAVAYMFTGYFIIYLTYTFMDIDAILPYVLWSVERYLKNKKWQDIFVTALFVSLTILGQQPQSTIIAGLFWGGYLLWRDWRRFPAIIAIVIIACAIALPFLADIFVNYQQGVTLNDWNSRGTDHFTPIYWLHFLVPPAMALETAIGGHLYDHIGSQTIPYIGISVLLLVLVSFWIKKKPWSLYFFYFFIAAVLAKNAGLFFINWIGNVPILKLIGWHKAYGPMSFAAAAIAAYSFDRLQEEKTIINWRGFFWTVSALPILFLSVYLIAPQQFLKSYVPNFDFLNRRPETIAAFNRIIAGLPPLLQKAARHALQFGGPYATIIVFSEAIIFAAITLALIYLLRRPKHKKITAVLMITVISFELWLYMPKIRDGFRYVNPYEKTAPYIAFLQQKYKEEGVNRVLGTDYTFMSYAGELYEVQVAKTFSAVKPKRYIALLPDLMLQNDFFNVWWYQFGQIPKKFFNASNIKYIVSQHELHGKNIELIYDKDVKIYRNTTALPKAYVVFAKETAASPAEAREKFYNETFNEQHAIIIEDGDNIQLAKKGVGNAAVIRYQPQEITIKTKTDQLGVLVLAETFYPGWRAYVDNQPTPIYPANVSFRAIALPAGIHLVRFVFQPPWFWRSVIISLIMSLVSLMCIFYETISKHYRRWAQR